MRSWSPISSPSCPLRLKRVIAKNFNPIENYSIKFIFFKLFTETKDELTEDENEKTMETQFSTVQQILDEILEKEPSWAYVS